MKLNTEAHFAGLLDRRLHRHNDRLWSNLLAWSEVLGALGWCVAVKDAAERPQFNRAALAALESDPMLLTGSWSELECHLARTAVGARPVQTTEVQVWAHLSVPVAVANLGLSSLTPRETEVLHWLREGKAGPEIAIILGCAPRTVESHVAKIYRKLGVNTRTRLLTHPDRPA